MKVYFAVIAWNTICVQLFVLPFLRKRETLVKEYLTNGVLDAAKSFIEANRLIPTLATVFVRIREAQPDRRRALNAIEVQQLLQEVDYLDDLAQAQEAMAESTRLDALFTSLERGAGLTWVSGLCHAMAVLAWPLGFWLSPSWQVWVLSVVGAFAVLTLVLALCTVFMFSRRMNVFLDLLKANRKGPQR